MCFLFLQQDIVDFQDQILDQLPLPLNFVLLEIKILAKSAHLAQQVLVFSKQQIALVNERADQLLDSGTESVNVASALLLGFLCSGSLSRRKLLLLQYIQNLLKFYLAFTHATLKQLPVF